MKNCKTLKYLIKILLLNVLFQNIELKVNYSFALAPLTQYKPVNLPILEKDFFKYLPEGMCGPHLLRVYKLCSAIIPYLNLSPQGNNILLAAAWSHDVSGHPYSADESKKLEKKLIKYFDKLNCFKSTKEIGLKILNKYLEENPNIVNIIPRLKELNDNQFFISLALIVMHLNNDNDVKNFKAIQSMISHEYMSVHILESHGFNIDEATKFVIFNHLHYSHTLNDLEIAAKVSNIKIYELKLILNVLIFCDIFENGNNSERLKGWRNIENQPLSRTFEIYSNQATKLGNYEIKIISLMLYLLSKKNQIIIDIIKDGRNISNFSEDEINWVKQEWLKEKYSPTEQLEILMKAVEDSSPYVDTLNRINFEKEFWRKFAFRITNNIFSPNTHQIKLVVNPTANNRFVFDRANGKIIIDGKVSSQMDFAKKDIELLKQNFFQSDEGKGKEIVHSLLYGDLYYSENHWVYLQGELYTNSLEMNKNQYGKYTSMKTYPAMVINNKGEIQYYKKIKLENFDLDIVEENGHIIHHLKNGSLLAQKSGSENYSELKDIDCAFFIKPIVEDGKVLSNEELGKFGDDMNWYFSLPLFQRLPNLGFKNLYFGTNELLKNHEKRIKALKGNAIELSLKEVFDTVFEENVEEVEKINHIHKIFTKWGYIPVNSSIEVKKLGDYYLQHNSVIICLKPGVNPLSLFGIDEFGKIYITEVFGQSRITGATVKEAAELFSKTVYNGGIIAEGTDLEKNKSAACLLLVLVKNQRDLLMRYKNASA